MNTRLSLARYGRSLVGPTVGDPGAYLAARIPPLTETLLAAVERTETTATSEIDRSWASIGLVTVEFTAGVAEIKLVPQVFVGGAWRDCDFIALEPESAESVILVNGPSDDFVEYDPLPADTLTTKPILFLPRMRFTVEHTDVGSHTYAVTAIWLQNCVLGGRISVIEEPVGE